MINSLKIHLKILDSWSYRRLNQRSTILHKTLSQKMSRTTASSMIMCWVIVTETVSDLAWGKGRNKHLSWHVFHTECWCSFVCICCMVHLVNERLWCRKRVNKDKAIIPEKHGQKITSNQLTHKTNQQYKLIQNRGEIYLKS